MQSLIIVVAFISFFGLILSGALKMEYFMDYLRMIYPEKMQGIATFKDAQLKLKDSDPGISGAIFVPLFRRRNRLKEEQDEAIRQVAKKITNTIISFWIFAILFLISFIGIISF